MEEQVFWDGCDSAQDDKRNGERISTLQDDSSGATSTLPHFKRCDRKKF